ncbi:MAG: hypothetical protein MJZ21_04000 [archaeon]|nr:hypothetical protein [archaeon]
MSDRVAFIDAGTNSFHMIVVDFSQNPEGETVYSRKETIRLGKSLYDTGFLDEATLSKVDHVFAKFREKADKHGAEVFVAMATSAAREAPNGSDIIDIASKYGIKLNIISGPEEARITRLGVAGPCCDVPTLCVDIGGGSTEIALTDGTKDIYLDSLALGAIRMAFGSGIDQSGVVTEEMYNTLRKIVSDICSDAADAVRGNFIKVFGSSGTIEAVAEGCAGMRGDEDTSYVLHSELAELMKLMCSLTIEERSNIPKVSPKRADIVIGGGVVLDQIMRSFGIERLTVSRTGLREGMKVDYLIRTRGSA